MMIHYRNLAPPMCQGLWISGTFRLSSPCVAAFPEKALPKREEQALSVPAVAISAMRSSQALLRLAGGRRLRCTKQVEAGRVFKILAQLPDIFSMMCFSWFFWRRIYDLYDIFGEHIMGLPVFFTHVCWHLFCFFFRFQKLCSVALSDRVFAKHFTFNFVSLFVAYDAPVLYSTCFTTIKISEFVSELRKSRLAFVFLQSNYSQAYCMSTNLVLCNVEMFSWFFIVTPP